MKVAFLILCLLWITSGILAQPATPVASPTPDEDPYAELERFTINGLRAREYPGGTITIVRTVQVSADFTRYLISYPSDNLTITGILQIPPGTGPFPVIILNHGYIRQVDYWSGYETWEAAGYLNRQGYLTISPDYRSWGGSDWDVSFFHGGLTADVINLISALPSLPLADSTRIGMWGHSMGGGITTKALTIDPRIDAAILYATNSADDSDLVGLWGPGCIEGQRAGRRCNRGEVIPADTDNRLYQLYLDAARDPDFIRRVAPIYFLDSIQVPVQIHIGTNDTVVPPAWSTKFYNALLGAGKNVEIFWYEGQDHTFYDDAWSRYIARTAAFFERYVMNGG